MFTESVLFDYSVYPDRKLFVFPRLYESLFRFNVRSSGRKLIKQFSRTRKKLVDFLITQQIN